MSFLAKRVSQDNHVFYIHKLNLDFNLDNKSLEIDLTNSVLDGTSKRQHQPTNKEYTENGIESTSIRSETSQEGGRRDRLDFSNAAESAISRGRTHRGDRRETIIGRKKPKFLN